jgi:hypothetical protein
MQGCQISGIISQRRTDCEGKVVDVVGCELKMQEQHSRRRVGAGGEVQAKQAGLSTPDDSFQPHGRSTGSDLIDVIPEPEA